MSYKIELRSLDWESHINRKKKKMISRWSKEKERIHDDEREKIGFDTILSSNSTWKDNDEREKMFVTN